MTKQLQNLISKQFRLNIGSEHGLTHWKRVEAIGLYLANFTKADRKVVSYFAFLHDSQRENNDEDIAHGPRAKEYVMQLIKQGVIKLTQEQAESLTRACAIHTSCLRQPEDITIATCLDADRLDLWRLGIEPSSSLLFTLKGKEMSANKRLYDNVIRNCA